MTKLLKTAAIAALITGFANTAQAGSPYAFQTDAELAMVGPVELITPTMDYVEPLQLASLEQESFAKTARIAVCLLYTSPSPRDRQKSRMPSSA